MTRQIAKGFRTIELILLLVARAQLGQHTYHARFHLA